MSDKDCAAGRGSLFFNTIAGEFVGKETFVSFGGTFASNLADTFCIVRKDAVVRGDIKLRKGEQLGNIY